MPGYKLPPPRSELKWLAVDFDDSICQSNWSVDNPTARPGAPIKSSVEQIHRCIGLGWKIAVHTARPWSEYEIVESWMDFHKIPFTRIICGKVLAFSYLDDRAKYIGSKDWTSGLSRDHRATCNCGGN